MSSERPESLLWSESAREDPCEPIPPPQVMVLLGTTEEQPVAVICKNIYIEYALIHAIGKSLAYFPTITTLKFENCCISKEIAEALAYILSEGPGKGITELSLNGNGNIGETLPLFFYLPTGLKYLSLQNCNLDDKVMKFLCPALEYKDGRDLQLQVLNLGMNKIGDEGAWYLAHALRTNRTLASVSLMGNRIGTDGASYLAEVLQRFKLTHEEVMLRRRRVFNQILQRKNTTEKFINEWKQKGEPGAQNLKITGKNVGVRKIRGPDGKVRCYSSKERRGKTVKTEPGEKIRGKSRGGGNVEDVQIGAEPSPSQMAVIAQQVENLCPPDKHPFVCEVTKDENGFWCEGCWSLANLNLSFNYLTFKSLSEYNEVLQYHSENFKPRGTGLFRLVLMPEGYLGQTGNPDSQMLRSFESLNVTEEKSKIGDPEKTDVQNPTGTKTENKSEPSKALKINEKPN